MEAMQNTFYTTARMYAYMYRRIRTSAHTLKEIERKRGREGGREGTTGDTRASRVLSVITEPVE